MNKKYDLFLLLMLLAACMICKAQVQKNELLQVRNDAFMVAFENYGIKSIQKTNDIYATDYVKKGKLFGDLIVRYKLNNKWDSLQAAKHSNTRVTKNGKLLNSSTVVSQKLVKLTQTYNVDAAALTWSITLKNEAASPMEIGDLVIPLPYNYPNGEDQYETFERQVVKHSYISGDNSFIFWERPTGLGPYLVMTPQQGTSLEYFNTNTFNGLHNVYQVFIHSAYTAQKKPTNKWRQSRTSVTIAANESITYRFKFQWAKDYKDVKNILFKEQLIAISITPGMTIPTNLDAKIALHTQVNIDSLKAEFPASTVITKSTTAKNKTSIYTVKFSHLGENKITIHYNGKSKTILEFFVTEPLEVLYKKRAKFIVNKQQHRDSTKWYNGLFSQWDMEHEILRSPDDVDIFKDRLGYVLASDDPALCKAPFLAAKNVFYPDQKEIDAIEYYIEHFVWGKLQRTDKESPYPYGIYGTPNWLVNRDTVLRAQRKADKNQDKMHIWRSYDYPHIMMLYYHMYQIAELYPNMTHYLDKKGYLERAKETAIAYFKYPYEILPWYETYKWGCYNELLIPDLIKDIAKEGATADADWLRSEWEKKVKYFLYDDPYPFRSEYAIDATAYESTYAFAKYADHHILQPDKNLWYDKNFDRWYSHPEIKPSDGKEFMERQLQANIASRGWLETAYYYMGSDFRGSSDRYLLSYMAQMGGWGILDYALNYSNNDHQYLGLGYASYLSSFALINSGTEASNYGYWYPGEENDGAAGWALEPLQETTTWVQRTQERGIWNYDGEIDLGFGGALRMAATIVSNDSIFGWIAYGGSLEKTKNTFKVIPKDGLQRRLFFRDTDIAFDMVLHKDGFVNNKEVMLNLVDGEIGFYIENRTKDSHKTELEIKGLSMGLYKVMVNQKESSLIKVMDNNTTYRLEIPIPNSPITKVSLHKTNAKI